jgi:hypothetical protein
MRNLLLLTIVTLLFSSCDPATLAQLLGTSQEGVSEREVAMGLKEALEIGIGIGSEQLSKKDGYFKSPYKILLPPEVRKVTTKLEGIPFYSDVEDILLEKINRGAEDAAMKAKPIFVSAIKSMTFSDAMGILFGGETAATDYLYRATNQALYNEFNPVIVNSLNKFNAIEYWGDAVNVYNKIPFTEKLNPRLDDYVTKEALKGLFAMVEKEEKAIRKDPLKRVTSLLQRVFGQLDNK